MAKPNLWIALLLLLFSLVILAQLPEGTFWITDCSNKYLTAVNLEKKEFCDFSIDYPGREFDPACTVHPIPDIFTHMEEGKIYSILPPLFSFISAPFHRILGFNGLYFWPLLGGLICFWLMVKIAGVLGFSNRLANLCGLTLFFCTPCFFYTYCFWEHTLANAGILLCIYLLILHMRDRSVALALMAGLVLGFTTGLRDEFYLFSAAVFVALLLDRACRGKTLLLFTGGNLLGLLPLWGFQHWAMGNALGFHISDNLGTSKAFQSTTFADMIGERLDVAGKLLGNVSEGTTVTFVFVSLFVLFSATAFLIRRENRKITFLVILVAAMLSQISFVIFTVTQDSLTALYQGNGLLVHGALLIPGLAGFLYATRTLQGRWARLLRNVSLLFGLLMCATSPPSLAGGVHWGPRFFLPLFPLMLLLTFMTMQRSLADAPSRWKTGTLIAFAVLVLVSFTTQIHSLDMLKKKLALAEDVKLELLSHAEEIVVSDIPWFPQDMAAIFYEKTFFFTQNREGTDKLVKALRARGEKSYLYMTHDQGIRKPIWRTDTKMQIYKLALFRYIIN